MRNLLVVSSLAFITTAVSAACSWASPGAKPYMGSIPAAIDAYTDIPIDVRTMLKAKMGVRAYDDIVEITKSGVSGRYQYVPALMDMHFGGGMCSGVVDRSAWTDAATERALIYCVGQHCIAVPTVCRNVSRIIRRPMSSIDSAPKSTRPWPEAPIPRTVTEPNTMLLLMAAFLAFLKVRR